MGGGRRKTDGIDRTERRRRETSRDGVRSGAAGTMRRARIKHTLTRPILIPGNGENTLIGIIIEMIPKF
ncbi:hypothetical protein EUGRSUZ_J01938 [Eucalyptus grandis]|uniref:Uncharacterized protein n=2 Tax=Eucalyptus grandis TaxID=71139 RepID=A0ACC3J6M4_EUCGR|nr:hypothetical protein EUGRSUZ_J01938 [Eucalyptus grandis]